MAKKMTFQPGVSREGLMTGTDNPLNRLKAQSLYNLKFIPKDKIIPNEMNDRYDQNDLESLSDSIAYAGLLHNLVVIPNNDETFRLVSGERRWRAISMLSESDYERLFPTGIPCKIQSSDISDIDEEISLISANSEVRHRSVEDNLEDVRRLAELYAAKGKTDNNSLAIEISKALGISERQTRKYINVGNLVPELSDALTTKQISFEDASKFASLGETEQLMLADILNDEGKINKDDYEMVKEYKQQKALLDEKDRQIKQLQQMLKDSKNESEAKAIRKTIEKKNSERQSLYPEGVSRKELIALRKQNKAKKSLESIENALVKMESIFDYVKNDDTCIVRLEIIKERIENLLKKS